MYLALERYSRPRTIEEALRLLAADAERSDGLRTALLGGGSELNVRGHEEIEHLIDLQALPFGGARVEGDELRLGAGVTLARVRREEACAGELLTGLREAAAGYAVLGLQNRSTVGGRVVLDRGDQDLPPVLAALGAKLVLQRLEGGSAREQLIDYPLGAKAREALQGALVSEVRIPLGPGRSAYRRFGRSAVDAPLANAACVLRGAPDAPRSVLLAANMRGPGAADMGRLSEAEALAGSWNGERPADWRAQLREAVLEDVEPYEDAWASGAYRRDLTATLAVRALAAVLGEEEVA